MHILHRPKHYVCFLKTLLLIDFKINFILIKQILLILISFSELATSGVCCMRKTGEIQAQNECQWLSDERPINPNLYVLSKNSDKQCSVVVVKFANGKFIPSQ